MDGSKKQRPVGTSQVRRDNQPWYSTLLRPNLLMFVTAWAVVASCIVLHGQISAALDPWTASRCESDRVDARLQDLVRAQDSRQEVLQHASSQRPAKKNLIFLVSDGMGPASLSLTRSFVQERDGRSFGDVLLLDTLMVGHSRTRSSNSLVTDSAAGATAFAAGLKSYNGAISVNPQQEPVGSVLEAAKAAGYMTGLVVSTRITDATPACFCSHVRERSEEDRIAEQILGETTLGRSVDLILGGGRCHFLPGSRSDGCRADDRDLVTQAIDDGWSYIDDRAGFDSLQHGHNVSFPLLGLLAPYDIPFDLDRDARVHPSLEETAKTAMTALARATENSDKGFFLLIESSRIDHAGHNNDAAAQVREVLAYDATMAAVLAFANQNTSVETVVLATSDHETGGLSVARQDDYSESAVYAWYPEVLINASHSGEYLAQELLSYTGQDVQGFVEQQVINSLGIVDATPAEIEALVNGKSTLDATHLDFEYVNMVNRRAHTGWSSSGHSAVDVNVYAYANNVAAHDELKRTFLGTNENTHFGQWMPQYLDVDVNRITNLLRTDSPL